MCSCPATTPSSHATPTAQRPFFSCSFSPCYVIAENRQQRSIKNRIVVSAFVGVCVCLWALVATDKIFELNILFEIRQRSPSLAASQWIRRTFSRLLCVWDFEIKARALEFGERLLEKRGKFHKLLLRFAARHFLFLVVPKWKQATSLSKSHFQPPQKKREKTWCENSVFFGSPPMLIERFVSKRRKNRPPNVFFPPHFFFVSRLR